MSEAIDIKDKSSLKKRGLGRGLNALFEDEEQDFETESTGSGEGGKGARQMMMGLDQLSPGTYQPRRHFTEESLDELAASIAEHGVLQPLVVRLRPGSTDAYEIIAGERRWRASQRAQLHEVPVIIVNVDDGKALEIALIENLQREDLNPVEEALGYRQLMEEFGHTQERAAKVLGKSRSHVANTLRLLTLPDSVLGMIRDGRLSAGHARTVVAAENPEQLAKIIVEQGLTVRDAEKLRAETGGKSKAKAAPKPDKDVNTLALEDELMNNLGMKVSIDMHKDGKGGRSGTFKVAFKDLDQLDLLLRKLSS